MAAEPENWFILLYGLTNRQLEIREFGGEFSRAADEYTKLEGVHRADPFTEVVLLGADRLETIKKTHSHYFVESDVDLFEELLRAWGGGSDPSKKRDDEPLKL